MGKLKLLGVLLIAVLSIKTSAQQFTQAVGIRGGISSGFEYRIYTNDLNSYKLLFSSRDRGLQVAALKEFHEYDLFSFSEQLVLIYGIGVHAGYERWDRYHYNDNMRWAHTNTAMIAGMDCLAGIEYTFYEIPLSLGLEVKPYFDVFGREAFEVQLFDFAFTLKYLF